MKLKAKLIGSFAITLTIALIIGIIGIVVSNSMKSKTQELGQNWIPSIIAIQNINNYSSELRWNELRYMTRPNKEKIKSETEEGLNLITKNQAEYEKRIAFDNERENWNQYKESYDKYLELHNQLITLVDENKIQEATKLYDEQRKIYDDFNDNLQWLVKFNIDNSIRVGNDAEKSANSGQTTIIIVLAIAIISGIAIALIIANSITKPVVVLSETLDKVASGDLTVDKVSVNTKDEVGLMAGAFNNMLQSLKEVITKVSEASQQLAASSEELSASSEETTAATEQVANTISQLSVGATTQAEEVENTSTIVNQMSASIQQVAANTQSVSQTSINVSKVADNGYKEAENAVNKIDRIREVSTETANVVKTLGQESERIGQIVDVIKGIADQTNLLALNAAIEAARAGEQGRGFAVVAEEVRKLAEQSSDSAQQIAELIGNIQKETNRAVEVIEVGTTEVAEGVTAVNKSGESFKVIVNEINKVVGQIQEVSAATQEMASGSNDVVKSIDSIASIAEQTAASSQEVSAAAEEQTASMEEVARSAEELAKLAEDLQKTVSLFKI